MMVETRLLKSFGYDVVTAKSGEEAVKIAIGNDKIALILMDVNLGPGMDGTEAARQILGKRNLPVVFLSSHTEKEYVDRIKGIAGYGYVVKNSGDMVLQSSIEMAFNLFEAQEAMRESEELYRSLFDNMLNGFAYCRMIFDQERPHDFIYLKVNSAFESLTGLKNVVGKNASEVIPGMRESDPELLEIYGRVALTGKPERFEKYVEALKMWFSVSVYSTGMGCFVAVFDVITGRKRAEEQIRFQSSITENISDAITISDVNFAITYMNKAGEQLYGYALDEIKGKMPDIFNADPMSGQIQQELYKTVSSGKTYLGESLNRKKDGSTFHCEYKVMPLKDPDGKIIAYVGIQRDITERKRSEQELKESKALLDAVVENIPLMIFLKEATDLRFVIFNRAGEELLGYDRKALLGKNNLDLFPPDQAAHFMAKDREVLDDGAVGMLDIPEEPILTAKRGNRLLHTRKVCIRGADGTTKFLLGISEDITERKLMQEKLLVSEKLAVMGRLIADVSHEINNPLAIIAASTQLLEVMVRKQVTEVADLEADARMFEKLNNATNRCKKIVASLLVSTCPTMLDIRPVDMNKLIKESLESMDDQFRKQNVKVIKAFAPRLPMMEADGLRLSQVFINMFTNACDAMPEGGELVIATRLHAPGKGTGEAAPAIEIEISDTGEGIRGEDLSKIFDPFYTTKNIGKGVGLGLSISLGIVRQHGGDMSVNSEKGKGSTFTILLPCEFKEKKTN